MFFLLQFAAGKEPDMLNLPPSSTPPFLHGLRSNLTCRRNLGSPLFSFLHSFREKIEKSDLNSFAAYSSETRHLPLDQGSFVFSHFQKGAQNYRHPIIFLFFVYCFLFLFSCLSSSLPHLFFYLFSKKQIPDHQSIGLCTK